MKVVNMLRSVVALGRTRQGNHNRADDALRGATAVFHAEESSAGLPQHSCYQSKR